MSYDDNLVLDTISFEVRVGERVGLIGRNGSGKTTLLSLLSGKLLPDAGSVYIARGTAVETLDQFPVCPLGTTVRQALLMAFAPLHAMEREILGLQQQLEHLGEQSAELLHTYDKLVLRYEVQGGYEQDLRYARTTQGLGITESFSQRLFEDLSGGEKTKINLARILLAQPDLLLLDEPTNHLDLRSIEWFEDFLVSYPGTVILISHDRTFLDRAVNRVLELAGTKLSDYFGNYTEYMAHKEHEAELAARHRMREEKEIARLTKSASRLHQWGIQTKRLTRAAMNMRKRVDRIKAGQAHPIHRDRRGMRASLASGGRSGDEVLHFREVAVGYEQPLLEGVSFTLWRGDRVALLGDNGTGKTTLLKLLTGELFPLHGSIALGANVHMGFMPQHISFERPDRTLLDTLLFETKTSAQVARDRLAVYDFLGEEVFKRVADLSGGERVRLKHCLLSFQTINLFVLDEPTNHLDTASREWVENLLEQSEGTLLFVSHDRYFVRRIATRILAIQDGRLLQFEGGFDEWQESQTAANAKLKASVSTPPLPRRTFPQKVEQSPLRAERALQRELAVVERELLDTERAIAEVETDMELAAHDYTTLEMLLYCHTALKDTADSLFEQWSALSLQLEEMRT